jgi:DNA-binding transcriptional LysR family regulator
MAGRDVSPQDSAEEPMILLDVDLSRDCFTGLMTDAGAASNMVHRITSLAMVHAMVGHGMGCARLATRPDCPMNYDGNVLVMRPLSCAPCANSIVLVQRTGRDLSPGAERFAEVCRARVTG